MPKRKNNQGYSLVEMIIVLAIIAVVAGMSVLSVSLIHSARAKEAAVTVDSEIATLITKSKNMKSAIGENYQYAARIYRSSEGDDDNYYFQKGYYNLTTNVYDFNTYAVDPDWSGQKTSLTSYVVVKYSPNGVSEDNQEDVADLADGEGLYIRFDRDGTCVDGVGDIGFYKRNGSVVAHEYIRANGSHQSK